MPRGLWFREAPFVVFYMVRRPGQREFGSGKLRESPGGSGRIGGGMANVSRIVAPGASICRILHGPEARPGVWLREAPGGSGTLPGRSREAPRDAPGGFGILRRLREDPGRLGGSEARLDFFEIFENIKNP